MWGWLYWLPATATMAAIAFVSHQPDLPEIPGGPPDWLLHGIEFGFLAATCLYGATRGFEPSLRTAQRLVTAALVAIVYGPIDEWHQSFVGRQVALTDVLADAAGAALIVGVFAVCWRHR